MFEREDRIYFLSIKCYDFSVMSGKILHRYESIMANNYREYCIYKLRLSTNRYVSDLDIFRIMENYFDDFSSNYPSYEAYDVGFGMGLRYVQQRVPSFLINQKKEKLLKFKALVERLDDVYRTIQSVGRDCCEKELFTRLSKELFR